MVTFLITSFIILAFLVVVIYVWQKPNRPDETDRLPEPLNPGGLFDSDLQVAIKELASAEQLERRSSIVQRATSGEKSALKDAHLENDLGFYNQVLDSMTDRSTSDPQVLSLVSYVTRSELPVNTKLAQAVFESWLRAPDRGSTAKTLHIIALSDDASLYNEAVSVALKLSSEGQLADVAPEELISLIEGEFWLLSSGVRGSGAGFLLKRTLARARRELSRSAHVHQ
jgi:hypothetical protein